MGSGLRMKRARSRVSEVSAVRSTSERLGQLMTKEIEASLGFPLRVPRFLRSPSIIRVPFFRIFCFFNKENPV